MLTQTLYSSPESTGRKLGSMFISFSLHVLLMGLLLVPPFLFTDPVTVEAGGSMVANLKFTPLPGDPHQVESRTNAFHVPRPHVETVGLESASKIKPDLLTPVPAIPDLMVIGPVEPIAIPTIDRGHWGACGCVRRFLRDDIDFGVKPPFMGFSSGVKGAVLLKKVEPRYPAAARESGIQGAVVIHAIIDREGAVKGIEVLSGPALLRAAAVEAVSQWRYQPYVLDGLAVDVETTITVKFELNGVA